MGNLRLPGPQWAGIDPDKVARVLEALEPGRTRSQPTPRRRFTTLIRMPGDAQ